jgi:3-oxoacyl-[acyl-carrier-protein] synthase-1
MKASGRVGYPVTAWSTVNALGTSTDEVRAGLRSGRCALSSAPPGTPFATVCGAVHASLPRLRDRLRDLDSRNNRIAQQALSELAVPLVGALERWGADRVGICVGSSTAALDEIERAYAIHASSGDLPAGFEIFARGSSDGLVRALRRLTGCEGPVAVVSNACASGGKAFAGARQWLQAGVVDAVLVGGADSLCQITLRGFRALGLLSEEPARPFSRERHGINIGEGAAFALIERRGEGPRLLGAGESSDAHHMTTPDPEGSGARAAMEAALAEAGVRPSEVDYVNAHGTGTVFNDAMEARAIRAALGAEAEPIVISTKGYIGHTLGAAGAIEAVFVLEALRGGWTPASLGCDPVDEGLGLNVPSAPCEVDIRVALSNSFAFGGSNVTLVFGRAD